MFFSRIHSKNRFLSLVLLLVPAVCTGTHTLGLAADRVTLSFIPSKSKPAAGSVVYHYSFEILWFHRGFIHSCDNDTLPTNGSP